MGSSVPGPYRCQPVTADSCPAPQHGRSQLRPSCCSMSARTCSVPLSCRAPNSSRRNYCILTGTKGSGAESWAGTHRCHIHPDLAAPVCTKARALLVFVTMPSRCRCTPAGLGFPDFRVTLGDVHGWRCRARLAVRGWPGAPVIGLYRAGTHEALSIPDCRCAAGLVPGQVIQKWVVVECRVGVRVTGFRFGRSQSLIDGVLRG